MNKVVFKTKLKIAAILFILANIIGVFNALVAVTTTIAEGRRFEIIQIITCEFIGSYSFFILSPVMFFLMSRQPITKYNLYKTLPVYLFTAAILGGMHTWIMYILRTTIYDLAGWGEYYYGDLFYRYIMETLKLSLGFFILYIAFSSFRSNKEKHEQKLKAVKLKEQLTGTRLELLKNQIHPHFLFNTLNMISSVMFENVKEADKMIANLSDLLRMTLSSKEGGIHKLKDEIKILDYYLEIMKARYKDQLDVVYQINNECLDFPVPSFILQPLIENSIKYGMEKLSSLKIIIGAEIVNDKLKLFIKDNGPGIQPNSENLFKKGVGLSNTQERLERLYSNKYDFYWQNLENEGLIVTTIIPGKI